MPIFERVRIFFTETLACENSYSLNPEGEQKGPRKSGFGTCLSKLLIKVIISVIRTKLSNVGLLAGDGSFGKAGCGVASPR